MVVAAADDAMLVAEARGLAETQRAVQYVAGLRAGVPWQKPEMGGSLR